MTALENIKHTARWVPILRLRLEESLLQFQ